MKFSMLAGCFFLALALHVVKLVCLLVDFLTSAWLGSISCWLYFRPDLNGVAGLFFCLAKNKGILLGILQVMLDLVDLV